MLNYTTDSTANISKPIFQDLNLQSHALALGYKCILFLYYII